MSDQQNDPNLPAEWGRQWDAWYKRMRAQAQLSTLYDLADKETHETASTLVDKFLDNFPGTEGLGEFINAMAEATPDKEYPPDLTKWPRNLPTPPHVSAATVEEFRKAAQASVATARKAMAAALAAEMLYLAGVQARMLHEDHPGWSSS